MKSMSGGNSATHHLGGVEPQASWGKRLARFTKRTGAHFLWMGLMAGGLLGCSKGGNVGPEEIPTPISATSAGARQPDAAPAPTLPPENAVPVQRNDIYPGEVLLDDFSKCDASLKTMLQGWWYTYDDRDKEGERACNHGNSSSELKLFLGGYPPSPCGLAWRATLSTKARYAFAGMGVGLDGLDLNRFKKMVIVVRGDGRDYRVKFPMQEQQARARAGNCGNDNWNFYGQTFACGNGSKEWVSIRVDLTTLTRDPQWRTTEKSAEVTPLNLSQVKVMEFQTLGETGQNFACDIGMVKFIP